MMAWLAGGLLQDRKTPAMSSAGGDCGYIAAMSGKPASEVAQRSQRNKHVAVVDVDRFRFGHRYNHS
nr:hypothetical protein [Gardnerella vaginalis]